MADDTNPDARLLAIRDLVLEARTGDRTQRILDGISLDLRRGEVLGLVGESGAGKSSLGLAAMGFARAGCHLASGTVTFDGRDLLTASEDQRRRLRGTRIAYVAQSAAAAFNPAHRLLDQTAEAAVRHDMLTPTAARDAAVALYKQLQLPDEIGFRYPHQVSGGQLQRVMTAMAMLTKPDLIIFDEPTTALDVTTQLGVLTVMRDAIAATGAAALYISHDLAVVAQMANRIMVLRHGRTVEVAETRRMLEAPEDAYTKSLWAVRTFRRPERAAAPKDLAPLLRVEDITAAYGTSVVLHHVGIALHAGRTLAIVGESGSGKSTLARVIAGLLAPASGRVLLDDRSLAPTTRGRTRADLRQIQMVFQAPDTALNPRRRVRDEIGRPLALYEGLNGSARETRIRELLAAIELDADAVLDKYPAELSGGQKQRVAIARAVAAAPRILICDEPTSALDQIVAEEVLRLLSRLQAELGLAILFITHDLATVRAIADDVVVMKSGRIVRAGSRDQVFRPPLDDYTAELIASVPDMDPDWLTKRMAARDATASVR